MNRIISKEKEREDPRRDSSKTSFQLKSKSFQHFYTKPSTLQELQCFQTYCSLLQLILHTELILPKKLQLQASSSDCSPCIQAFYTAEQGSRLPVEGPHVSTASKQQQALQAPRVSSPCSQLILPGRKCILSGSQHPQRPYKIPQAHSYRILQGEIGFIPKGLSIVYPIQY